MLQRSNSLFGFASCGVPAGGTSVAIGVFAFAVVGFVLWFISSGKKHDDE